MYRGWKEALEGWRRNLGGFLGSRLETVAAALAVLLLPPLTLLAVSIDADASWIEQLYLLPAWGGQGIGTKMLDLARAELRPPIRLYTFQANERARCFYESRGFRALALGGGTGKEEKGPGAVFDGAP